MATIIVYFHGYRSSPNTPKVRRLEGVPGSKVFAYEASVDPDQAVREVSANIDSMLLDDVHRLDNVVFVGTSLGGWLASKLAHMYDVPAVLINPSTDPSMTLAKYGVDEEVRSRYSRLVPRVDKDVYFFAQTDDVIPNEEFRERLCEIGAEFYVDERADHGFNGEPFERVIEHITNLYPTKV